MKFRSVLAFVAAGALVAGVVVAQPFGYGPGPGMMGGGYGMGMGMGYGMGPGMMGGPGPWHGAYSGLNLSDEQRKQIADIQLNTGKAMFEMHLQARKQIDAVLTAEQREQLRRSRGNW